MQEFEGQPKAMSIFFSVMAIASVVSGLAAI